MGTNYYWVTNDGAEPLHIGKSSYGWCFGVHLIPELGILNLADWQHRYYQQEKGFIRDEEGDRIAPETMDRIITARESSHVSLYGWKAMGYHDEADFHRKNHSSRDPSGLLRHTIRHETFCIGHGSGSWDYMVGEFS